MTHLALLGYIYSRDSNRKTNYKRKVFIQEEKRVNRTELVAAIAEEAGISKKDADAALKAFVNTVEKELKAGGKVQLVGFGTFEVSKRAARTGRNPQTGEAMEISASKSPKFKAGKAFKDILN